MVEEKELTEKETESEEKETEKKEKKKKVVRRRKSTKEKIDPIVGAIRLAVESGKVVFGSRSSLKASSKGVKLLVIAKNAPAEIRTNVLEISKTSKTPILEFEGTTMELGSVCGKPFPVSVLSIFEEGNSNILELAKKKQ